MLWGLLIALGVAVVWRSRHLSATRAIAGHARRPIGANGIVVGGEAFVLERANAPAVLLLHGAGDTPQSLRYLADALFARGFHVVAPLLPGHGRAIEDFSRVTADMLAEAAEQEYASVRRTHDRVAVIGLSMGGALAVQLAAEHPEMPALGLLAPYLAMPPRIERAARLAHVWGPLWPVVRSREGRSILDRAEERRNLAYGVFTPRALRALWETVGRAAARLPDVTAPTLMIQSREDNRISVAAGERAFASLGSREKRLEWITGASHIITVDYGRDAVFAHLAAFMETHMPPRVRAAEAATSDS